jgi:cytidylate kinase
VKIAIDGPAGAGKSTVAAAVAFALNLPRVDTGAMYRALAFLALEAEVDPGDGERLRALLERTSLTVEGDAVRVDGRLLRQELRTPAVDRAVSVVATHRQLREEMARRQRAMAERGAVVDGRDIGTHVLPDADLKVFLTASAAVRAERRARQLAAQGFPVDVEAIQREIEERDRRDAERAVDPLRPAPDAVILDTSSMTVAEVVATIVTLARERSQ